MGYIGAGVTRFNTADELTVTGNAEITGAITTDGMTTTGNVTFGDNDKAIFGAGSDLQIYHDASHSRIKDSGTGNIIISADNFQLKNAADTKDAIYVASGGAVTLYYDSNPKLATTSTGVDVTGTVNMDGAQIDGVVTINGTGRISSNGSIVYTIDSDSSSTDAGHYFRSDAGTNRFVVSESGDISFYDSTGVTQGLYWDASTQRLGLGTTSPVATLEVDGSTTLTGGGTGSIHVNAEDSSLCPTMTFTRNGGGTITNGFLKFENSGGQVAEVNATGGGYFLGNVGIGTSSPATTLDVQGGNITQGATGSNAGRFLIDNTTDTIQRLKVSRGGATGQLAFHTGADTEAMRITSGGNVGIGTSSPNKVLHLETSGETVQRMVASTTNLAGFYFGDSGNGSIGQLIYDNANDSMRFNTNGGERVRITSGGNVGIGTSSPLDQLSLVNVSDSNQFIGFDWIDASTARIRSTRLSTGNNQNLRLDGQDNIINATNGTERMRIDSSGKVGIGTSSPSSSLSAGGLHVTDRIAVGSGSAGTPALHYDADTDTGIFFGSGTVGVSTGGTERMRIDSVGNVLVGNSTAPSAASANAPALLVSGPNDATIQLSRENATAGGGAIQSAAGAGLVFYTHTGAVGSESYSERMRIGSNGHLYATCNDGSLANLTLRNGASGDTPDFLQCRDSANNAELVIQPDGDVVNANGTYGSISDQKLKENIIDASSQWDDIKALQIRKYNLIGNEQVHIGVVAQELEAAGMSGLVSESIDFDGDGNDLGTTTKSVKYSILHTKALKALQEAMERIEELEARIAALEAN